MTAGRSPAAITIEDFEDYFAEIEMERPSAIVVEEIAKDWVQARIPTAQVRTRPGGYVPGPVLMGAVDFAGWILVFTRVGICPMAVTWDLKINFLRPAVGSDVIIQATQTKFGRFTHATYDLYMAADPTKLVAHATTTYAIPDKTP